MIKVFGATDKVFTSNGDIVIKPLKAKAHKSDTEFYLDIEVPIEYLEYITQGRIVVVDTNTSGQAFRINNVTVTGKKISARCNHVFFDTKSQYFVEDVGHTSGTCTSVLNAIVSKTKPTSPYVIQPSGISGSQSVTVYYESLYDALVKTAQAFGGYLLMNNYVILVSATRGTDNGVVIRYGKNLKDISCEEDWSDVCTRIYPFGANGITVDSSRVGLEVPYIDSDTQYDIKYIKYVEFDQSNIKREDYDTESAYTAALIVDLIEKGEAYLVEHALPKVNYTIKANVEKISNIGDTIVVIDERLGLELETEVTAYDYDCILGKFTEVTFGNYRKTAKGVGLTVDKLFDAQSKGIMADKRLLFKEDNSIAWEYLVPQP